jgi:ribonuclease E
MAEKLLINVNREETRVALVESGVIMNLEIDTINQDDLKGNIYKGVVHRVNPSLQAAFVDFGIEKQGFLPVSEIHPNYYRPELRGQARVPIREILRDGQELMVQVVKDEIGNKGASLSTYISLPGRYLVLMAESEKAGISRRLSSAERDRLRAVIDQLEVPDGFGVIIRTAGIERDVPELQQDLAYLKRLWENLERRFKEATQPVPIHHERSVAMRFLRDYATDKLAEIHCDDAEAYEELRDFCTVLMPEMRARLKFYDEPTPLFSRHQVEDQIDDIFARRIDLPSGGYLIIDQTEALVSIDINSGKVKTSDIEETALKTNLEAATEIARQLKLRDLGGLIVADFIDMRDRENNRKVEQAFREAFDTDKAKTKFTRISEFGLMELSRQRLKTAIMRGSFHACDHCGGTGKLRSVESSALYLLRRLKESILRASYLHVTATMPIAIANYMLNRKRHELLLLEQQTKTTIDLVGSPDCPPMSAVVEILTTAGESKRPRRIIQRYDLVRSEVEKKEVDETEEILLKAADAREVTLTPENYDNLYREIEREMAREIENSALIRVREEVKGEIQRREAEATLAPPREADPPAAPVVPAPPAPARVEPTLGVFRRIWLYLFGTPPGTRVETPVVQPKPLDEPRGRDPDPDRDRDRGREGRGRGGRSDGRGERDRRDRGEGRSGREARSGRRPDRRDEAPRGLITAGGAATPPAPSERRRGRGGPKPAAASDSVSPEEAMLAISVTQPQLLREGPRPVDAVEGEDEPRRRRRRRRRRGSSAPGEEGGSAENGAGGVEDRSEGGAPEDYEADSEPVQRAVVVRPPPPRVAPSPPAVSAPAMALAPTPPATPAPAPVVPRPGGVIDLRGRGQAPAVASSPTKAEPAPAPVAAGEE